MADNIFVSTLHQFKLAQSSHAICSASSAFPDNFTVWSPFHTQPASKGRTLLCTANNLQAQAQAQKQAQALAHKQIVVLWFPLHRASALVRNFTLHKIQEQVIVISHRKHRSTTTWGPVWGHKHMQNHQHCLKTGTWTHAHDNKNTVVGNLLNSRYF